MGRPSMAGAADEKPGGNRGSSDCAHQDQRGIDRSRPVALDPGVQSGVVGQFPAPGPHRTPVGTAQIVRRVSATRACGARAGWQQVKMSRNRSSTTSSSGTGSAVAAVAAAVQPASATTQSTATIVEKEDNGGVRVKPYRR